MIHITRRQITTEGYKAVNLCLPSEDFPAERLIFPPLKPRFASQFKTDMPSVEEGLMAETKGSDGVFERRRGGAIAPSSNLYATLDRIDGVLEREMDVLAKSSQNDM